MGPKMQIKGLIEERNKLAAEIEAMTHRLAGLDQAIAYLMRFVREGAEQEASGRRRMAIKDGVLKLLAEYRDTGLTAAEVVEMGKTKGSSFDRASVSSLLSRLKRDGVLTLDQATSKYRIAAPPQMAATASQSPSAAAPAATGAPPSRPVAVAAPAPIAAQMPPRPTAPPSGSHPPTGRPLTVAEALAAVTGGRK